MRPSAAPGPAGGQRNHCGPQSLILAREKSERRAQELEARAIISAGCWTGKSTGIVKSSRI